MMAQSLKHLALTLRLVKIKLTYFLLTPCSSSSSLGFLIPLYALVIYPAEKVFTFFAEIYVPHHWNSLFKHSVAPRILF